MSPGNDAASRPLRVLEVAALPFPSPQGTQAMIREGSEALARRGHEVHLLVYAHGDRPYSGALVVHRLGDFPRDRSLRSGPSLAKLALDGRLAVRLRRLESRLGPDLVLAHNYEALAACLAARPHAPLVYRAHTLFGPELPTFARGRLVRAGAGLAGGLADRLLPRRAVLTVAVSPRLEAELLRAGHPPDRLAVVTPGIDLPGPRAAGEAARRRLGLEGAELLGYCGNLDAYQGLDTLLAATAALARRRPALRLLVVTASEPTALRREAARRGLDDRLVVLPHGRDLGETIEDVAAADVCVVPRSVPGGFPIKLLTYLAAGRPVVATESGTAGLELGEALVVVPDRDEARLAAAASALLDDPAEAARRGRLARRLAETRFAWSASTTALEGLLRRVVRDRETGV